MAPELFRCESRYFRDDREYQDWFFIRSTGFSAWYVPPVPTPTMGSNRRVANAQAAIFPEFFFQVRTSEGRAVAYLASAAGYWSGEPDSLQDMTYINAWPDIPARKMAPVAAAHALLCETLGRPELFEPIRAKVRARRLTDTNTYFLLAMTIHPDFHGFHLPALILDTAKTRARELKYAHLAGPFRPSAYGRYKAERRAAHSVALFSEYCQLTNGEGLPVDPWLRTVARQGGKFLRLEPRSFSIAGSLQKFEAFRRSHKPDAWYSPSPNVWECGETCTWYVDPARRSVLAVEPNYWGHIPLA